MIYLTQRLDHAHRVTASVTLPIDMRVKSRAKVALNDGREAGLMLPRGLLLRGVHRRWQRGDRSDRRAGVGFRGALRRSFPTRQSLLSPRQSPRSAANPAG